MGLFTAETAIKAIVKMIALKFYGIEVGCVVSTEDGLGEVTAIGPETCWVKFAREIHSLEYKYEHVQKV